MRDTPAKEIGSVRFLVRPIFDSKITMQRQHLVGASRFPAARERRHYVGGENATHSAFPIPHSTLRSLPSLLIRLFLRFSEHFVPLAAMAQIKSESEKRDD